MRAGYNSCYNRGALPVKGHSTYIDAVAEKRRRVELGELPRRWPMPSRIVIEATYVSGLARITIEKRGDGRWEVLRAHIGGADRWIAADLIEAFAIIRAAYMPDGQPFPPGHELGRSAVLRETWERVREPTHNP